MTFREIIRQAAKEAVCEFHKTWSIDNQQNLNDVVADAVALAVLREVEKIGDHDADVTARKLLAEFDAPGAQERTTVKNDDGAGLAAVVNDTGPSTTETARERIIEKGCEAFDVHGEGSYLAAAAEALTILQEQKSTCWCDEESPVDVIPLSALQALTAELSDGNQGATQSSGRHRGSAAQKTISHSRPSLTEET